MNRRTLHFIPLVLSSVLLSNCATRFDVGTDFDQSFNFSDIQTFAVVTPANIDTMVDDLAQERVEMALNEQLEARGYERTSPDQADVLVSYFSTTQNGTDIQVYQSYNSYYHYNRCYRCVGMPSTQVRTVNYTQGMLLIDIVEPSTETLKWRGQTTARFSTRSAATMTAADRDELVNSAVLAILNNFPPGYVPLK